MGALIEAKYTKLTKMEALQRLKIGQIDRVIEMANDAGYVHNAGELMWTVSA